MNDKRTIIIALLVISFICTAFLIIHNAEVEKTYVDINAATKEELMQLPSIGEILAERIIEGRPYQSIEDIKKIYGIGGKRYTNIKDRLVIK